MKFLVVHPGASWSTHDVHMGVVEGLRANGIPVAEFRLDTRIDRTHDFLHFLWRRQRKATPERKWPKPSPTDVLYQASQGLVERALERGCTDVLVISAMFVMPDRLELARRAGLRVWLLCTETPYEMENELRLAGLVDGVWTHERAALEAFQAVNARAAYLPHAWRAGVHDAPATEQTTEYDVLFCGSLFEERLRWFEAIDWSGINLALYGVTETIPKESPLRQFIRGSVVPNDALVSLARRSKLVINFFRAPEHGAIAESLNPRCYEMAASGVCMVSDYRPEVAEKFGDSVRTFSTPHEASAVIRSLLVDPEARAQCVAKARQAVALDSWTDRSRLLVDNVTAWQQPRYSRSA